MKIMPTRERLKVERFWIGEFEIGGSCPLVSTRLSDGTLNWQNARKRNIAWEPGTVAALEISNLFDGGVVIAGKFPPGGGGTG